MAKDNFALTAVRKLELQLLSHDLAEGVERSMLTRDVLDADPSLRFVTDRNIYIYVIQSPVPPYSPSPPRVGSEIPRPETCIFL